MSVAAVAIHAWTAVDALIPPLSKTIPVALIERVSPCVENAKQPDIPFRLLSQDKFLLAALLPSFATTPDDEATETTWGKSLQSMKLEKDEVVRVVDSNTVKLKRSGLVSFAAVQTPSGYSDIRFPDCLAKSPSFKARQLLPPGTKVGVRFVEDSGGSRPRGSLIVKDGVLVNAKLVRAGFARPVSRGRDASERILPGITEGLASLQREAQESGLGMYKLCQDSENAADDQFEPLEFTLQTKWGDDGGQPLIVQQKEGPTVRPRNPGDTKGCSDFATYEDALRWFEKYFPWYGDVAKLDRDQDGVPCPGLPHTKDPDKYRMKVPSRSVSLLLQ